MNYSLAEQNKIKSNIWKFTLLLITNKRAYTAILSFYYLTIPGVQEQQLGWILLIGSVASFLFEIPSGFLSDKIGHRNMLILTRGLMLFSTAIYIVADSFALLIFATIILSMAFSSLSGSDKAFMFDTLQALGKQKDYSKIMGKASSIGFAVPIVFMALPPSLIEYSYKAPFVLSLLIDIIGLITAISLVNVKHVERRKDQELNLKQILKNGFEIGYMPFAILAAFISGILLTVQFYRAPFQEFAGADVAWFGIYFTAGRLLISVLLMFNGKFKEIFNVYTYQQFRIAIYFVCILALGFIKSWQGVVVVFLLLHALQWGFMQTTSHFMLELISASHYKATLLSIRAQISQAFAAVSGLAVGYLLSVYSYNDVFIYIAVVFIVLSSALYVYICKQTKGLSLANEL